MLSFSVLYFCLIITFCIYCYMEKVVNVIKSVDFSYKFNRIYWCPVKFLNKPLNI